MVYNGFIVIPKHKHPLPESKCEYCDCKILELTLEFMEMDKLMED